MSPISSPLAILICNSTKSKPVTSSVTGCSTWILGLTSKKYILFFDTKNSTVAKFSSFESLQILIAYV